MSSILFFSDVHFWKKTLSYLKPTLEDWMVSQIYEHKPDLVVFGGDLNHTHNSVDTDVMHAIASSMDAVAAAAKEVTGRNLVAISGNHDTALRGMQKNIVEAVATLSPDIEAYTKPYYLKDFDILLIPYPDGSQEFIDKVASLGTDAKPAIAIVHVELSEIRYTPANTHVTDKPFTIPESVKTVLAGHYHHPESKVVAGKNIHIVGSPIYHNYSDQMVDLPRGALLFDTLTHSVTRLHNPHGQIFHTVTTAMLPKLMSCTNVSPATLLKTHMRVKVDSKEEYDSSKPAIESLRAKCASLRVIGKTSAVSQALQREETKTLDMNNPMDLLIAFCKKNTIEPNLVSVGKQIMEGLTRG
jgi:UDP-2,3-diacylglucosamine pyrophosphatase LpxH